MFPVQNRFSDPYYRGRSRCCKPLPLFCDPFFPPTPVVENGIIVPYSAVIAGDLAGLTGPISLGFGSTGVGVTGSGVLPNGSILFPISRDGILKNLFFGLSYTSGIVPTGTLTATLYVLTPGASPIVTSTGITTSLSLTQAGSQLLSSKNVLNTFAVTAGQSLLLSIVATGVGAEVITNPTISASINVLPTATPQ